MTLPPLNLALTVPANWRASFKQLLRFSLLWVVLFACTANVCNSFFIKWGFRDDSRYASLVGVIDGSAYQPYVYRSTVPRLADLAIQHIPAEKQEQLFHRIISSDKLKHHFFNDVPLEKWTPRIALDYHLMYGLTLLSFLVTLIYLRKIFLYFSENYSASILAVVLFSLMYPLTFKRGGYFYDFFELLGITVSTYYFLTNRKLLASILLMLTAFNKETAFVAAFGFFFLHAKDYPMQKRLAYFALQFITCFLIREWIIAPYTGNTDTALHFHLLDNAKLWLNPVNYFKLSDFYTLGLFSPTLQHVLLFPWLAYWIRAGWQRMDDVLKKYTLGIFIPNLLLFLNFTTKDEFRNFSLSMIALYIVLIHGFPAFRQWLDQK